MFKTLKYYLREIPKRPWRFLVRRGWGEIMIFMRCSVAACGYNPYTRRLSGKENVGTIRILDLEALDSALDVLMQRDPTELSALVDRADRICDHEIEVFCRTYRVGSVFEWNRDFESGYLWPFRFHGLYNYDDLIDIERRTDVKVPWEVGRLQYLPILGLAYRITREDRYVATARDIFIDWERANTVGYGIQWVVGMEVALRAISLILSAELLAGTPAYEQVVDQRFVRVLEAHGRFLYRNIEYSDINGNHHTSCLVGLLYLGVWLAGSREAPSWRSRAVHGLRREVLLQTYPDGVCHEGSIPYHRLVAELFLHALFVARRAGVELGEDYRRRLELMMEFVGVYTKPSGEAPVWGDCDDGRVHHFGVRPINDHRYLLSVAAAMWDRSDFWAQSDGLCLDSVLLLDSELLRKVEAHTRNSGTEMERESRAFCQGGFYILRRGASWCLVDCGDVGLRGRGGHGHNDALSVELVLDGIDILTDSGCAAYTRSVADRVFSISATSHNVAIVDDLEPSTISHDRIPHATECLTEMILWQPEKGVFVGRHMGYRSRGVDYYERRVELSEGTSSVTIVDHIVGNRRHGVRWYFHFAETWIPVIDRGSNVLLRQDRGDVAVALKCRVTGARLELEKRPFYPSYAQRRERWCLIVSVDPTPLPVRASFEASILRSGPRSHKRRHRV